MAAGGGEENDRSLKYTSTLVVAVVCSVIVLISLLVERFFHFTGKYLKKKNQVPLYEALQKVKEELMLLGFISFLMTVFQDRIVKFCVSEHLTMHFLPCKFQEDREVSKKTPVVIKSDYCGKKGKVPLLTTKALHHLHIFIFVLAIVHVTICALTISFCGAKIRQWKHWEDSIAKDKYDTKKALNKITHVHQHSFIKDHRGIEKFSGWLHAFVKQFYASVTKSDYIILRHGFIMTHCRGNPKFDFHKYMTRALEADFKKVVGISWFLWIFVVIFLLVNIDDLNAYFWIAFFPLIVQYGFDACIMGKVRYIVPRLVISVFIQVLCSYSTLPLYAIVRQMGTSFKKEIFEERIQAGLLDWAKKARKKQGLREADNESSHMSTKEGSSGIQLEMVSKKPSAMGEEGSAD